MRPTGFLFMTLRAASDRAGAANIAISPTAIQNSFGGASSVADAAPPVDPLYLLSAAPPVDPLYLLSPP